MFRKRPPQPAVPESPASVTEAGLCRKALHVHVTHEEFTAIRQAVVTELKKQATLPGFRQGKAPAQLVENRYAQAIHQDSLQRATQQALEQAVKTHGLKPVGSIEVRRVDFNEADGLRLEAQLDVEPSFELVSYKGIPLSAQDITVTADEINQALEKVRESMAQLVPAENGQGKQQRLPNLDDELAKDAGYPNLERLRAYLEGKLREQKRQAQRQTMESSLCEELLRRHAFEVPAQLVSRQTDRLTQEFKTRLLLSGISEEAVPQELEKFTGQLRQTAQQLVRLDFLLDRIAAKESIRVTSQEAMERLWQLARQWRKDPSEVRKIFDQQGLWPSVIATIRRQKTTVFLMKEAISGSSTPDKAVGPKP